MKILYVTTVGSTMNFFLKHIEMLQGEGHEVELAANFSRLEDSRVKGLGCIQHHISFSRKVCKRDNFKAYFEIKKLMRCGDYDIVHTHTPNASALVRLAGKKLRIRKGMKVFYTAHGFHFYKGAPLKNWLLFFWVEKICAYWTDVLITINKEDYVLAKRYMTPKKVEYVPGIGIDIEKFANTQVDLKKKREELGIGPGDIMLLSVGELNENKNHRMVIEALGEIRKFDKNGKKHLHYFIAGEGELKDELKKLADREGIRLHLLGFRNDVAELLKVADIFILPSIREGLNVSLMEAMACKLPIICSKIRGNTDLITEGKGGFLFIPTQKDDIRDKLERLIKMPMKERYYLGEYNYQKIQKFSCKEVNRRMQAIYKYAFLKL